jgi:hypothetical protein
MAGPDRHGRGRRGARHVQEAPHAVIRRLYAASIPRVFQVWEVSGDREYRICRVYSETVYNRCIIKYMPVLRSDVRAGSGGRNRENQNRKLKVHAQPHASRAARASPPATAIARTGLRSAARPVRRCDREVRGPVRPRGRGLWRSVPAVRPPAGAAAAARASAGERVNRTKPDNRRATGTAGRGVRQHGRCRRFFAATSTWSNACPCPHVKRG